MSSMTWKPPRSSRWSSPRYGVPRPSSSPGLEVPGLVQQLPDERCAMRAVRNSCEPCGNGCEPGCNDGCKIGWRVTAGDRQLLPAHQAASCITAGLSAIPDTLPLGSTVRSYYQVMETNAEAADFIFHQHDFIGETARADLRTARTS